MLENEILSVYPAVLKNKICYFLITNLEKKCVNAQNIIIIFFKIDSS